MYSGLFCGAGSFEIYTIAELKYFTTKLISTLILMLNLNQLSKVNHQQNILNGKSNYTLTFE